MKRITLLGLAVVALALLSPASSYAQATRTWVSGVGDDANPCSRTAPCKTWAGAISKTAAGGEMDALDPGGFGALTVTKSITIDGGGGQVASVLVAGTNGIVVAAASNDVVIIRNLRFDGLLGNGTSSGTAGLNGILFLTGAQLTIEKCEIFGFGQWGINFEPNQSGTTSELLVINSVVSNSGVGTTGGGIVVQPQAGTTGKASITGTNAEGNVVGFRVDGAGTSNTTNVVLKDSVSAGNAHSGVIGSTTNGAVNLMVNSVASYGNNVGVAANGSGANVYLGQSTVTGNNTGISQTSSGVVQTYKTNQINGNTTDGTPITAQPALN